MYNNIFPMIVFIISGLLLASIVSRIDSKIKDLKNTTSEEETKKVVNTVSEEETDEIKKRKEVIKTKLIKMKKELSKKRENKKKNNIPLVSPEEETHENIRQRLEEEQEVRLSLEEITRKREKNRIRKELMQRKERINSNAIRLI